jgi:hypothetical protein
METASMDNSKAYDWHMGRLTVLARGNRERERTTSRHTVAAISRWWLILIGVVFAAACGGSDKPRADTYARASHAQEECCEHLAGDARAQCLGSLVTVNDPAVASTSTNQDTYACVMEHFECDPATGHATQASAQSQLDCIQDL